MYLFAIDLDRFTFTYNSDIDLKLYQKCADFDNSATYIQG